VAEVYMFLQNSFKESRIFNIVMTFALTSYLFSKNMLYDWNMTLIFFCYSIFANFALFSAFKASGIFESERFQKLVKYVCIIRDKAISQIPMFISAVGNAARENLDFNIMISMTLLISLKQLNFLNVELSYVNQFLIFSKIFLCNVIVMGLLNFYKNAKDNSIEEECKKIREK
jgi:hypothetical protein